MYLDGNAVSESILVRSIPRYTLTQNGAESEAITYKKKAC